MKQILMDFVAVRQHNILPVILYTQGSFCVKNHLVPIMDFTIANFDSHMKKLRKNPHSIGRSLEPESCAGHANSSITHPY
jgi:hypothetical protein